MIVVMHFPKSPLFLPFGSFMRLDQAGCIELWFHHSVMEIRVQTWRQQVLDGIVGYNIYKSKTCFHVYNLSDP